MKDFLRIMLLAMMVCCWSCSGGGEDVPTPTPTPKPEEKPKIEVTTTAPVLSQEGETATVIFTSSDLWTIDVTEGRAVSWCSVTPTSGSKGTNTLTIKTTDNDTYDERNAKVTIKAGVTTQSFVITQKQKDGLTVTSNKVEIGAGGGDATVEVKANVKYEYEIEEAAQSWIASDGSRALTASTIKLKVAENENTSKREGKITIRSGELAETVTIYQEGSKPTIVLTQNEYTVVSEGETIKVELKSNINYDIQLPSVDWIKESSSRAMSVTTHYFEVASNEEYDARSSEILFVNKDNGISEKVTINQMQKDAIIVAKNEYTVDAAGDTLNFEVNTNVDFKVETSVDWMKQNTESRGLESKPLSFTIAENTADKSREGVITITSGDLKQEIKVIQKAKTIFSVSLTEFKLYASGGEFELDVTSNGEYTIEYWESWLKEKSCETISSITKKHTFSVAPNTNYYTNEGHIYLTNTKTNENVVVKVIVAEKFVEAQNEYNLSAISTSLEFELLVEDDYKIEIFDDWIVQRKIDNETGKKLVFDVEKNKGEVRSGRIMFTTEGNSQYVIIKQQSGISNNEGSIDNMPEYEW